MIDLLIPKNIDLDHNQIFIGAFMVSENEVSTPFFQIEQESILPLNVSLKLPILNLSTSYLTFNLYQHNIESEDTIIATKTIPLSIYNYNIQYTFKSSLNHARIPNEKLIFTFSILIQADNSMEPISYEPPGIIGTIINKPFEGAPFNGILSYISSMPNFLQDQIHLSGWKIPKRSMNFGSSNENIINNILSDNSRYWVSSDPEFGEQPNFIIDFKLNSVLVTHYSIETAPKIYNRNWILEGSNDLQNWIEIDRRDDEMSSNKDHQILTFECPNNHNFFKFIRMRVTGFNSKHDFRLALSRFELFGVYNTLFS